MFNEHVISAVINGFVKQHSRGFIQFLSTYVAIKNNEDSIDQKL